MSEHVAASLLALIGEVNTRWPGRDRSSDGTIGDAAHQARVSDHNPDYSAPGARSGVIRAADIDKDGIDLEQLLEQLHRECVQPDPRVAYVIYDRRMMRSYPKTIGGRTYQPGQLAPYDGPSPHTGHVHVSINHSAMAEADVSPWFIDQEDDDMTDADRAQLGRIEKLLTALTLAETNRYADMANRVHTLTGQEAARYGDYVRRFNSIVTELAADDASPITAAALLPDPELDKS